MPTPTFRTSIRLRWGLKNLFRPQHEAIYVEVPSDSKAHVCITINSLTYQIESKLSICHVGQSKLIKYPINIITYPLKEMFGFVLEFDELRTDFICSFIFKHLLKFHDIFSIFSIRAQFPSLDLGSCSLVMCHGARFQLLQRR